MTLLCTAAMVGSCTQDEMSPNYVYDEGLEIRFSRTSSQEEENVVSSLDGYLFAPKGKLSASYPDIQITDGVCNLKMAYNDGSRLMLLANGNGLVQSAEGLGTIDELRESVYTYNPSESGPQMFMTGELPMTAGMKNASVSLVRGLARIDLNLHNPGIKVSDVTITGLADRMYVWSRESVTTPEEAGTYSATVGGEFASSAEGIAYILEQDGNVGPHVVTLNVEDGPNSYTLSGKLPEVIERNKVYAVNVYGMGQSGKIEIETETWEDGENIEASENISPVVDVALSDMGTGAEYRPETNELTVKFTGTQNTSLKLNVPQGYTPKIDGISEEVTLVNNNGSYVLDINSRQRYLGESKDVVMVKMLQNDEHTEAREFLKITFETTPVRLTGRLKFDETRVHDFKGYADGELGRLVLPEGWTVSLVIASDEDQWMKLDSESLDGVTRIVAGWRPNDPKADGRPQIAKVVLTETASGAQDEYTIKRQNWSLPVINFNGVWWCKYNLRGNVKNFADQVSIAEDADIKAQGDFATYMNNCSAEDFLRLAGDQYVGGKPDGLKPVMDADGKMYFDGYDPEGAVDFGSMPATQMAPDGFQIPTYDNYRFFTWGTNQNMGYNANVFNNGMSGDWYARLRYEMKYRTLVTDNLNYGDVTVYKFWRESNPEEEWVLFGLGHQWQVGSGNISPMYILFAISDRTGNTWGLEGYSQSNGSGNWYKYASHNSGKTRMIRCIKTPVEYIY